MQAPKCKFCGKVEWRHICATNVTSGSDVAGIDKRVSERRNGLVNESRAKAEGEVRGQIKTANRRAKEAYNAYQRVYMRSYRKKERLMVQTARALLSGAAEPWKPA